MIFKTKTLGNVIKLESGKHTDGTYWFSLFINLGKSMSLFLSRKTEAYDIARQSGIGGLIRWPFYSALFISVINYPEGSVVEVHRDGGIDHQKMQPLLGFNMNIVLKKATLGGEFVCPDAWVNSSRIKIFNGDRFNHHVTQIQKGGRIILAFKFSLARWT